MKKIDIGAALSGHLQEARENQEVDPNVNVLAGPARPVFGDDGLVKSELHSSPNYVRIVEAYRGFTEGTLELPDCIARLDEVLKVLGPGLKMFYLPITQNQIMEMPEAEQQMAVQTYELTSRIYDAAENMILAMRNGDHKELTEDYDEALAAFEDLDEVQDRAYESAREVIAEKRRAQAELGEQPQGG